MDTINENVKAGDILSYWKMSFPATWNEVGTCEVIKVLPRSIIVKPESGFPVQVRRSDGLPFVGSRYAVRN